MFYNFPPKSSPCLRQPLSSKSSLISLFHLPLVLPNHLCLAGFPYKILYAIPPLRATCPSLLILLDWITRIKFNEEQAYTSRISSLCNYFLSPLTSSILGSRVFLCTLLSNIVSLLSSRSSKDQLSCLCKRAGKIIFRYNEMCIFLDSKGQDKRVYVCEQNVSKLSLTQPEISLTMHHELIIY